jgi:hypothetical protein
MTGPFTTAGEDHAAAIDHVTELIAHELQMNALRHDPDGNRWAAWSAAAVTVQELREQDAANRRLLDQYQEFITGLIDQVNIMAGRDDVRDVIGKMLFNFGTELRRGNDLTIALGPVETPDVH